MRMYVTYGFGSNLRNNFSVVEEDSALECIEKIQEVCGAAYAFAYTGEDFDGQVERYGLTEVPLQAQKWVRDAT